jgi:hypothetical protein
LILITDQADRKAHYALTFEEVNDGCMLTCQALALNYKSSFSSMIEVFRVW